MVDFPTAVNPPNYSSFVPNMGPALMNFLYGAIGDLPADYQQGKINSQNIQKNQQQLDLSKAFAGGIPKDAQGNPDYSAMMGILAQYDPNDIWQIAPLVAQQQQQKQAATLSPLLAPNAAPPRPSSTPTTGVHGDAGTGTIVDIVTARLPQNSGETGQIIGRIAQVMNVDPNAQLSAGQQRRAAGLLDRYAPQRQPQSGGTSSYAPTTAVPAVGANARVAGAFASLPPSAGAVSPAPQINSGVLPQGQQGGAAPQGGAAQPLVPQVPLPKGYSDPQQAILALRAEAARLGANPQARGQVDALNAWADRIEKGQQPLQVGGEIVDPRSAKVLFAEPKVISAYGGTLYDPVSKKFIEAPSTASGIFSAEDARLAALRLYQGDVSALTGLGYGRQRGENIKMVYGAIREVGQERGLNEEQIASALANAAAEFQGRKQEQRTLGQTEARMGTAAFEAKGAIQLARGLIEKVPRTSFLPFNQLRQGYDKNTLNPDQAALYARTQGIINAYAAVMSRGANVTTDHARTRAEDLLNTAANPAVFNRVLDTLESEINMAIQSPEKMRQFYRNQYGDKSLLQTTDTASGQISSSASNTVQWVRRPDGSLGPAQ